MDLLQMSFSGTVLILAVLVIRVVAINKLPKKTFLALWGIVLLKLIVPFSIPSVFSVYSFVNQNIPVNSLYEMPMGNMVPATLGEPVELAGEMERLPAHPVVSVSVWFAIWLLGMMLCTAFFAVSYLCCRYEFRASIPVHNEFVDRWLKENQLIRPISVKQSDKISAPLTYGIFKPVILMPKGTDWENKKQLHFIFLHEYMHICHYDAAAKLVCTFALCIHWFNPLVWVMSLSGKIRYCLVTVRISYMLMENTGAMMKSES